MNFLGITNSKREPTKYQLYLERLVNDIKNRLDETNQDYDKNANDYKVIKNEAKELLKYNKSSALLLVQKRMHLSRIVKALKHNINYLEESLDYIQNIYPNLSFTVWIYASTEEEKKNYGRSIPFFDYIDFLKTEKDFEDIEYTDSDEELDKL